MDNSMNADPAETTRQTAPGITAHDRLPEAAKRVAEALRARGHSGDVVLLPESGKTSEQAAAGLGCAVAQIAKSIVFRRLADDAPVLVIASGVNHVDEGKVAAHVGPVGRANAQYVRDKSGYAIGGVAPIGHTVEPVTLIDADLLALDSLWAAAGHPHAVFNLTPAQLVALTRAPVHDVALRHPPASDGPDNPPNPKAIAAS
jgi:prolyl-tRNA editing enzyme YbaK/EbsC (Cys-tRNA(Pro) deacylase)